MRDQKLAAVASAVLGGNVLSAVRSDALETAHTTAGKTAAFTLAELLVSIGVLVLLVFLATQLLNSAASITTLGHKQMDMDAQARQLLDRMAIDFAQMVKRSDVDYYLKSSAPSPLRNLLQPGNDKIAFYSAVPGYYLSGFGSTQQSPVSLVSYRMNAQHKLERMGKGLLWNAVAPADIPIVFMPKPIASPIPVGELPSPAPNPTFAPVWPNVHDLSVSPTPDPNTEVVGSQVFRFEYYYLVSGQFAPAAGATPTPAPPTLSDIPWDTRICSCPPTPTPAATPTPTITPAAALCCHTAPEGMQDIAAVVVDIAVIDPKSRVLVTDCQLAQLNGAPLPAGCQQPAQYPVLTDFAANMTPGQLLAQWQAALDANVYPNGIKLSQPARAGIRVYERYLYLSPPNLQTP
jgi:hypothetical protein